MNSANYHRRKNLQILFNNTTLIPFKWRMKYLCFYCGRHLADYSDLKGHTKNHGDCSDSDRAIKLVKAPDSEVKIDVSEISCEICMELFDSFDDIVSHLIGKHNLPYNRNVDLMITTYRLSDLRCLSCERGFRFFRQLVSHMNNDHPNSCFLCHECNQTFNKKRDLDHHIRVYHKKEYSCQKCFQNFVSNSELQHHRKNAHLSTCNLCFKTFSSENRRLDHMKRDHDTEGAKCGFCHKIMTTEQSFLRHAAQCTVRENKSGETIVVEDDGKRSRPVKEIRNDIACVLNKSTAIPFKFFMNRFRCFYCSNDFSRCEMLKQHTISIHPHCDISFKSMSLHNRCDGIQIKIDIANLSCKLCFETLHDMESLFEHLTSEHKIRLDKTVVTHLQAFKLIEDNFPCPFCGEMFRHFSLLLRHVSKMHTDNKFICTYCGKSFRTNPSLRAHVVSMHRSIGRYKCDCGLVFTTNTNLKVHMGRAHGAKVVQCSECSDKFTSHYWMKRHMLEFHDAGHKCSYCGMAYVKNSAMVNHVRRFHLKERNVECPVCFERFFDAQRLKMHMVKHVGERNFHCDICGKKFLWKKNLRGHMQSHNKNGNS